jgi:hypothetical protein
MTYDLRWISDALKLPGKVIAGLFLFTLLLLAFDFFELVSLPDLHAVARPAVIIAALLFGSLCVAAVGAVIAEALKRRRRPTLVAQRRQIRQKEHEQAQAEREAQALHASTTCPWKKLGTSPMPSGKTSSRSRLGCTAHT